MQKFKTTADVFALVKADQKGAFRCPIKGCAKREHANAKDFGRHLSVAHGIRSPKHNAAPSIRKTRKMADLPVLTIKHCPHCGFALQELEQAAVLLRESNRRGQ